MSQDALKQTYAERSAASTRQLIAAAISLFAEKGYERTTAAEIGQRAGFSREMVRSRYGTKDALLRSLLEDQYEPLLLRPATEGTTGFQQACAHFDLVIEQTAENPEVLRAFFVLFFEAVGPVDILKPWMTAFLRRYESALADFIRQGHADGSIRADLDADRTAADYMAYGIYRAYMWLMDEDSHDYHTALLVWRDRFVELTRTT